MKCNSTCNGFDFEEFEREVCKTIEFPRLAVTGGNAIALFTMLVLKELLKQQTVNPTDNFNNIIAISNAIAILNSSIKFIQ